MSPTSSGEDVFSARVELHGETVVVEASGDLDLSVAKTFENELRKALSDGASAVVLDLAQVTFIDSAGLRALIRVAEEVTQKGARLSIRGELSPAVKRLLDVSGVGERLPFVDRGLGIGPTGNSNQTSWTQRWRVQTGSAGKRGRDRNEGKENRMVLASLALPMGATIVIPGIVVLILIILVILWVLT